MTRSRRYLLPLVALASLYSSPARADDPPAPALVPDPAPPPAPVVPVQPVEDPARKKDLEPKAALPTAGRVTFDVDPIADGAIIAVSVGFAATLDLINSTGEVSPQQISRNFNASQLIGIDRVAVRLTVDDDASARSNVGLFAAAAFAVIDPVLSGLREKNVQAGITDGFMYAESVAVTFAMTNMVKIAVRRPRPKAYMQAELNKDNPAYSNIDTDSSLSFFSGHASIVAAIGATATYLAFARAPHSVRPWITLALAAGLSTFVSIERVRSGAHFPTDVVAGTIAGAGVGIVVPHLHRSEDVKQRRVWVGFSPASRGTGGTAALTGVF